jgi:large repetitive protein
MRGKHIQKKVCSVILFFIFCGPLALFGQDLKQHNWYFGNSTQAVRFNRGTNAAQAINNQALPFNRGGAAVATDPATGNLLFYTDGVQVYDACHLLMPNGNALSGRADANQPVALSPVPGQANKYYIFTNSANFTTGGTISRSIVDLNQFGNAVFPAPATGVVEAAKNVAIVTLPNRSEGMMVVPHINRIDFWLITHENGTQNYSATLINAAATFPTTTTSGIALPTTIANFSYHSPTKKIAVSPQDTNTDAIILNFNDATGLFSFDRSIFNSGTATVGGQSIYDIEWDANGQYLYVSRHGEAGLAANVFQYDYQNPAITLAPVLSSPVFRSYGLQAAPDSAIYHLYQAVSGGPFLLGKFTNTDTIASQVRNTQSLFAATNYNATQFPSFVPKDSVILAVNFTSTGTCQNSPTTFFPTVTPNADSLRWDFGDGTGSRGWSPIYTYTNAGTFNVGLTAFYRGQTQTTTLPVTITAFALQLQLVQDTTACSCELPFPKDKSKPACTPLFSVPLTVQGGTPTSTVWSNGDIGNTLTPDSVGYYYVVVTDASGCSAYAGVNVKEYGIQDQRANVWYFGNRAGIDFNPLFNIPSAPARALNNSNMDAPEGTATMSDRNGKMIFYTDGDKLFDKTHAQIDVGIGGDPSSSQAAIIVPVPGDETLYYIFTTQAINGTSLNELRYSLFDLKLNSGRGALKQKNVLLFSKSTERITATPQWLIAHEYGNNTFRSYPITQQGIGEPVYSEAGSDHTFKVQQNGEGYMKIGPNNRLAVALSTPGVSNLVELFDLNNITGRINNYRRIDLREPTGQVYGVEFSPAGNKIFATVKGAPSPSKLFEYFIDSVGRPFFKQRIQQNGEFGAMQLGPDGQIYMAINGSTSLGTIQAQEDTTRLSAFNLNGFALLAPSNSRLGLPNFIQIQGNAFGGPGFSFVGICLGDTTRFTGSPTDPIDTFQWNFGDGASSTVDSPVHLYATAGNYIVSMRLRNRCGLDTTLVQTVRIIAPPPLPSVNPVTLCTGAITLDANIPNTPGLTHLWSGGETTRTVTFNQAAFGTVTNTDVNGCFSTAPVIVSDNRPQVDLGPDLTICEDNATPVLNAQNPGTTYQWRINNVNAGTIQTQGVTTTTPGIFTYEVTVTDPVTTCVATDQKVFTIRVSPSLTFTGVNPTGACGSATGSITLQLNASVPTGGPYSYFISGPGPLIPPGLDQFAPSTIGPVGGRPAGTYSVVVFDQISGCTISRSVGLRDVAVPFTANATFTNCDPSVVTATPVGSQFRYTFTNTTTGAVIGSRLQLINSIPPVIPGSYSVDVRDGNGTGCTSIFNFTIPTPVHTLTIIQNLCDPIATLEASLVGATATGFSWTRQGSTGVIGTTPILTITQGGTYQVIANLVGGCSITQTATFVYDGFLSPTFTQSNACSDQVILTAQPTGTFTYRWFKNNSPTPFAIGRQIVLGLGDGGRYQLEIINTVTGCTGTFSPPQPVEVIGTITAAVTATPACEDNKPFTLTATATPAAGTTIAWFRNGTVIPGQTLAATTQTDVGTYRVDVRKSTCLAQASIQIIKGPLPIGELLDRVIICNDPDNSDPATASVDLDPGPFTGFNWFKNQLTLNYTTRVLNADSEGLYEVDITNSFGCVSRDQTEVTNDCIPKIVAPNAFRPTSALIPNKDFSIFSFFITDNFQVFIFNRWGEIVFESTDRRFKWNGGYKNNANQPAPAGTYAYVFKYVSSFRPDKGIQEKRGGVSLIR